MQSKKRLKLIDLRKKNGWLQKDVASMLDIAEITVRSIENGQRDPSTKLAMMFAYLYGVDADSIFPSVFLLDNDTKRIIKSNKDKVTE